MSSWRRIAAGEDWEPEQKALVDWLMNEKKVVQRWLITKPLGHGANGVVMLVEPDKSWVRPPVQKAVLKVAIASWASDSILWEVNVLKALQNPQDKEDRTKHVVRMLDHGVMKGMKKDMVAWIVMEFLEGNPVEAIVAFAERDRIPIVCDLALHLLKGVYDMHFCGFLHRDLKPENMGMKKGNYLVLYDVGMARTYTQANGLPRPPRSYVGIRGTDEWASLCSELGRDQTRVDDLWGWFYTISELANCGSSNQQAWLCFQTPMMRLFMKSRDCPSQISLCNMPSQFTKIQLYLRSIGAFDTPDYFYLATLLNEARNRTKRRRLGNPDENSFTIQQNFLERQYF
ncbi:unnamed protein product, partial [Mesorhabditis spiculigera]